MSEALAYHRATDVPPGGTDEDEARTFETRPHPFKDYGDARRLPLEAAVAGATLRDGAAVVRTRRFPQGTAYFRGYSSAGALYPVEAYTVEAGGLYSFDALERGLVLLRAGDHRAALAEAAAAPELADAHAVIVVTGIHSRTGWKYEERGYRHVWWDAGTMLANLLALAAADDLDPRLYTAFVDRSVNELLGVDGVHEFALALLALHGRAQDPRPADALREVELTRASGRRYPLAERLHDASALADGDAVRAWRSGPPGEERKLDRRELADAIRRRGSVRRYAPGPLPRAAVAGLLEWAEASIPADASPVVRQVVTVAAVEGLAPGVYDAGLRLERELDERELRAAVGYAAMEQEHPAAAAVNVFQLADLERVVERLGDRGYRWAQLEAGVRAGRLQVGAVARGWGAAASTFYDDAVSRLLETRDAPLLMVAVGPR